MGSKPAANAPPVRARSEAGLLSMKEGRVVKLVVAHGPRQGRWFRAALISLSPPRGRTRWNGRFAPVAHLRKGRLCGQSRRGACRSEGLVAGEHVPDRLGQAAGDVDLGDLGTALLAQPALGLLVALAVERMATGVLRGLDQRPAQVLGPGVREVAAAVL